MTALALAPAGQVPSRHRYQDQDSAQTLAEGLAEYYAVNRGRVTPPASLPPESAALFRSHDICHVVFGLGTTLADEALADARTLLSCDVGWRRYGSYLASDAQARAIFNQVGYLTALRGTILAAPRLLRALGEARRMTRPWPWNPPQSFMLRPLAELRREFGVRVI